MSTNYDINYNDERFKKVESAKSDALDEVDQRYGDMIGQTDKKYQGLINESKNWADKQADLQQDKTDFAIQEINQQKEQAKKDYLKEQSGAYVDWQTESNRYGANAEQMAANGLQNSGYSESSQVILYNTYQNRVATAREVYNQSVLNYNNAIQEARLQNNSILAEIAHNALQTQLELALQAFQYKNNLITEQAKLKLEVDEMYHGRYQDVLKQINTENSLAEQVRQYNKSLEESKRHNQALEKAQQDQLQLERDKFAYQKAQASISKSSGGGSSSGGKKSSSSKSRSSYEKKVTNDEKKQHGTKTTPTATEYINALIASGATKDKVSNEISLALRKGELTKSEAQKLRSTFTPRGLQY